MTLDDLGPVAPPVPPAPARARLARLAPLVACGVVLAVAIALRLANFFVADRSPDEELWTKFGVHIAREGPGWITRTAHDFNRDGDVEFPWPQRVGYTCLVALAVRASGDTTVHAAEGLSTVASVAATALTGVVAWEFIAPWVAPAAMLFMAVSPLDLALARRAWQDDVMALLTLLMAWAFLRHLARGGRGSALAFFALSAYALTVKESAVIPFGLGVAGLVLAAWHRARRAPTEGGPPTEGRWRAPALMLLAGVAAALVAGGAIVGVAGGPAEFRHLMELAREALAPDKYLLEYQTGGVGYYVTGLTLLQPVPFMFGFAGALLAVVRAPFLSPAGTRPGARGALAALGWLTLVFGAVSFSYYSKNMRFLSPIYAPVFLLAAALLWGALARVRERASRRWALAATVALALALTGSAVRDALRFDHYFNEMQVQDLATPWFLQVDREDK